MTDDRAERLQRELAFRTNAALLEDGARLQREGRVFATEIVGGSAVYGAVSGEAVYAVTLDADDMAYSTCTCPSGDLCAHMAAVFFQAAEAAGRSPAALLSAMTSDGGEPLPSRRPDGSLPGVDDRPDEWAAWFEAKFGLMWQQCRHSLHPLQQVLQETKGKARDWPRRLQRLHWMTAVLLVLEQAERAYGAADPYNRYYYEMSFTRAAEPWVNHWYELAGGLDLPADERETDWVRSINARVRAGALDSSFTLLRWDMLAHALRERLALSPEWRQSERLMTEQLLASGAYAEQQEAVLLSAQAHLDVLEERVDDAIEALGRTPFERTSSYVYSYAEAALAEDRLGDAEAWLLFLRGRLAGCRNASLLRPFLKLCRDADVREPGKPLWIELMRGFLPHAYAELSAHYLSRRRYGDWADLQLAMGVRPDDLDAQDLREAAKTEPALLIPLFHQGVIDAVESRGRQGYRNAVRLLKRLEKLYEAAERTAVWQRYIAEFQLRYARLRALREEMKRGKLMP